MIDTAAQLSSGVLVNVGNVFSEIIVAVTNILNSIVGVF